jgi:hypothetical protein
MLNEAIRLDPNAVGLLPYKKRLFSACLSLSCAHTEERLWGTQGEGHHLQGRKTLHLAGP